MLPDEYLFEPKSFGENLFGKRFRRECSKCSGKLQEDDFIDSCLFEPSKFLLPIGQEAQISGGGQNFHGVRIEGQHESRSVGLARGRYHLMQQRLVAKMVSVEISDRSYRIWSQGLAGISACYLHCGSVEQFGGIFGEV